MVFGKRRTAGCGFLLSCSFLFCAGFDGDLDIQMSFEEDPLFVVLAECVQGYMFSYTHPPIKKVSCIVHIAKEIVFVSWGRRVMVKTSGDDTETTICNAMFPAFLDTCLPGEAARAKPDLHCPAIRIATTL